MAEWPIAPVLKTGGPQGSVGSNPTSSEFFSKKLGREQCTDVHCVWDSSEVPKGRTAAPAGRDAKRSRREGILPMSMFLKSKNLCVFKKFLLVDFDS